MRRLVLNQGRADERSFVVKAPATTIGRTKENDAWVLHTSLSRHHARIEEKEGRLVVVDLGSKNGTFVNGARVERRALSPGDTIRCGDATFLFVDDAVPAAGAAPTTIFSVETDTSHASLQELLAERGAPHRTSLRLGAEDSAARAHDKLEVLLKVSQLLSSPKEIDALLSEVLDLVLLIMDVDRAALLLRDPGTGQLAPRVAKSAAGTPPGRFYSENIVRYVEERGVAALFADAKLDPRMAEVASILSQSICSSMCAPIKPRDRLLGVLYVDNLSVADRFSAEDLEFLGAFASQAGVAIENSMLQRRLEEEAVLRSRLTRFFPPATVARLVETHGGGLEVVETRVTALFSDISGFTSMSARMRPREVADLLNAYFPRMADIVFSHGGTLEKYIGDALLAVWGAPFQSSDDADRALAAAVAMQRAMRGLNEELSARGKAPLSIHVGLNTGTVAAGNIGSERYLQYATLGDATNVASRVCGVAQAGEIVLAESTRLALQAGERVPLEPLGPVDLRGKAEPVGLYRVRWEER